MTASETGDPIVCTGATILQLVPLPPGWTWRDKDDRLPVPALALVEFSMTSGGESWTGREILPVSPYLTVEMPSIAGGPFYLAHAFGDHRPYDVLAFDTEDEAWTNGR